MSYHPVFNINCFDTNSTLFIPTFKSLWKPTLSNSAATLSRLSSKGLDEWEACEKLKVRREELKKLADDSTMPPTCFQDWAQVHLLIMTLLSQQLHICNHHHPFPPIHHKRHTFSQPCTIQHQMNTTHCVPHPQPESKPNQFNQRSGTLSKDHDNKIGTHEVVHTMVQAHCRVPQNNTAPGEYNPPPPPLDPPPSIHNMTQAPQVSTIMKHSNEHDKEHNEHIFALIATNAIKLSTSMLIGVIVVAAETAEAAATHIL